MDEQRNGTEIAQHLEEGPRLAWELYRDSGMMELIGSYHLVQVLMALMQSGLGNALREGDTITVSQLAKSLDEQLVSYLLEYLSTRGIVEACDDGRYSLTVKGRQLLSEIATAQLGFYVQAYGPVTQRIASLIEGREKYGKDVVRDGAALGLHCATLFRVFHTPILLRILDSIDARSILDVGCGGGQLLIDACRQRPDLRGIGLDICPETIEVAKKAVSGAGLCGRIDFVTADAFALDTWPSICSTADVLVAIGVLHEHFRNGKQAVVDILNVYSRFLRGRKLLILGEPEIYNDDAENDADLFLIHAFTAQGFPRRMSTWLKIFEETNLRCRRVITRPDAGPRFAFYELVSRQSQG